MNEVKQFSKSYILVSALYVVLGSVMLAWPSTSVKMIFYCIAFGMIVLGFTYGILFFTQSERTGMLQMDLVIGVICLAFGVYTLLNPDFLRTALPFAMGIVLILGAVVKIQSSINMKKLRFDKWYWLLISAILLIGMGIFLVCNILKEEKYVIIYIGVCLIFDGLTNLISMIRIQLRMKKLMKLQKQYPTVPMDVLMNYAKTEYGTNDVHRTVMENELSVYDEPASEEKRR